MNSNGLEAWALKFAVLVVSITIALLQPVCIHAETCKSKNIRTLINLQATIVCKDTAGQFCKAEGGITLIVTSPLKKQITRPLFLCLRHSYSDHLADGLLVRFVKLDSEKKPITYTGIQLQDGRVYCNGVAISPF